MNKKTHKQSTINVHKLYQNMKDLNLISKYMLDELVDKNQMLSQSLQDCRNCQRILSQKTS